MNAVNTNQPIAPEFWKEFLNDIPEFVWTSKFLSTKHINAAKNQFPMVGLNQTKPLKASSVKEYKTKIYGLSSWELTKLFSLGDPTIPEEDGGLSYEDLCRNIHNSGRTDIKKQVPPRFFESASDAGNNYSVALRRIYWYVNLYK